MLDDFVDNLRNPLAVSHVACPRLCFGAHRSDGGNRIAQQLGVDVDAGQAGPAARQSLGDSATQPARRSGNQRDLTRQINTQSRLRQFRHL